MTGPPRTDARGHIEELDGLRGVAILLVMLHHFWPAGGPLAPLARVAHAGWVGVDLFFVISGFLIAGILLDTRGDPAYYRNFYARRALRIFPLYYLFVAGVYLIIPRAQGGPFAETPFVRESGGPAWYLLYLGNVREAIVGKEPAYFLAPLWSLAIEEQFYLAFPLLVATLPRGRLRALLLAMLVVAPLFRWATMALVPGNERIQYLATPSRVDVLALGCLLAVAARDAGDRLLRWRTPLLPAAALAVLAACFALGGLDRTRPFGRVLGYSVVGLAAGSVVLWAVLNRGRACTAPLRSRPLGGLGKICYGVYLLQRPAQVALGKVLARAGLDLDPDSPARLALNGLAAVLAATASWFLLERPILNLKRRFASARHPAEAGSPLGGLVGDAVAVEEVLAR